jgi:hypothetical protein
MNCSFRMWYNDSRVHLPLPLPIRQGAPQLFAWEIKIKLIRLCINHLSCRSTSTTMISSFSEPIPVTSTTYQTTSSGNLISTRARIYGATSIVLHGRNVVESGVILRGDLRRSLLGSSAAGKSENDGQMSIVMGRYCRIGEDSVIRPPGKMTKGYVWCLDRAVSVC